jgi:hypothetical protein
MKCTYGDLDKLRDFPGRPGPLSKLMTANEPSIVNKFRIARLTRAINEHLTDYVKAVVALGKKYGTETRTEGAAASWSIKPENNEAYLAEKNALDAVECELSAGPLPFEAVEGTSLTALDVTLLGPFVTPPSDY